MKLLTFRILKQIYKLIINTFVFFFRDKCPTYLKNGQYQQWNFSYFVILDWMNAWSIFWELYQHIYPQGYRWLYQVYQIQRKDQNIQGYKYKIKSVLDIYLFMSQQATEYKNKGNEAFKAQRYEEAIEYFTKAIECNPNDHVFYSNRSGSYLNSGSYEKALEDAETCVKMNPSWPRGYQRKGTALFYLDKVDQAIATYNDGLKVDPNNADLQKDLKAAEAKKGEGANPQFNQAYLSALLKLMQHPQTKDLFQDPTFMQKLQTIMQNPQLASAYMQQDPRLQKVFDVLSQQSSPDDLENLAKQFDKQKFAEKPSQPQQKKEEYNAPPPPPPKAEQKKPEKMEVEDPAEDLKNKGNDFFKKKNFDEALNLYEQAIKLNPNEPLYYNNKAAAYIELKDYEAALQEIKKAETLFEEGVAKDYVKKAKVLARKGTIFSKLERFEDAIQAFEKSLLEDNNQKVKEELSKIKKHKKEIEAKQYINPELAEKHNEIANGLYKQGKFPQALKEYEEASRRNPDNAKYYSNIGQTYIKLMEFQRAKDSYDTVLKKDPQFLKAYHKKGDCHFFLKEYHKALEVYEQGLKKDPNDKFCRDGLDKTQLAIYSSNSQEDQEARAKRAMADPEIQAILATPEVRNALADLQRDPKSIQNILKDKSIAQKIEKLIAAGILRTG